MANLLTLSKAARLLGISRNVLQQEIRDGKIETFEGHIKMSELQRAYPTMRVERSNMVEKLQTIKDNAVTRRNQEKFLTDVGRLNERLDAMQKQATRLNVQLRWYASTLGEFLDMLDDMQENASSEQMIMIASLRTWLLNRLDQ